ncbi:thermonuclease family protein [Hirschia litorea]|uniref:Thermonuclease family protein n=1 Tax=Hirschia litorea TaxID=1199156 RepID=A0ABW2IK96_9PROT
MKISKYIAKPSIHARKTSETSLNRRLVLSGLGGALFLSNCRTEPAIHAGLTAGETGRVQDVRDGDSLVLDTGLSVRLAAIEAPRKAWKQREADAFGEEAANALTFAAIGRKCQLFYGGLTRDKYARAIAHVFVENELGAMVWLNGAMISQGCARVRSWADNAARVRDLYSLEAKAREKKAGLWALPEYQLLSPNDLTSAPYGLAIVEGRVSHLSETLQADSFCEAGNDGMLRLSLGLGLTRSDERLPIAVGNEIRVRSSSRRKKNAAGNYSGGAFLVPDHWGQFELI